MKKYLDVMLDTETLSRRPSAAIIQIAAKPFSMDGSEVKDLDGDELEGFVCDIDATSCAMYGMDFEKETVDWWAKNPARDYFINAHHVFQIPSALNKFANQMNDWCTIMNADELTVWCQGTDFDIALLREAYRHVFGSEDKLPWKYRNVRDARTYFLEAVRLFAPDAEKPYNLVKSDGIKHTALADCEWSIRAVQWAYSKFVNPVGR